MEKETSYNDFNFVSPCCNAFIYHNELYLYCSSCNTEITKLKDDQDLTISVKFNSALNNNLSIDVLNMFYNKLEVIIPFQGMDK